MKLTNKIYSERKIRDSFLEFIASEDNGWRCEHNLEIFFMQLRLKQSGNNNRLTIKI